MKIESELEYKSATQRFQELFQKELSLEEKDELEELICTIRRYENEHYGMIPPSPLQAIKFRMEAQKLKEEDLVSYLGSVKIVKKVLAGKKKLDLEMIRNLNKGLGIPAEVLIQDY